LFSGLRGGCRHGFSLTPQRREMRELVAPLCRRFDDAYWLDKD
jgi:hypothetical protein